MNSLVREQGGQEKIIISAYCFGRHYWFHLTTRKQYIHPLYGINLLKNTSGDKSNSDNDRVKKYLGKMIWI